MKPTLMADSSFSCEITILQARNTGSLPQGSELFVRCYLSAAGRRERIHLDTVDVPAAACSWDEAFSLQCSGSDDSIEELKQESLVFELRQRKCSRWRKCTGAPSSKLLGAAELPWRTAFEAPEMRIEEWVPIIPCRSIAEENEKPPSVRVAMIIRLGSETWEETGKQRRRQGRKKRALEGECRCCGCGEEYCDVFAMAAALEAF
ncbi:hypothetical protein SAY87_009100 [Trapa incisa]|uniref:C2 domain-containing protein n=2 Tax=Trapa TaxID=22665 RepID=A0AAN7M410_TRANT|nr:hypothetical protein SAY87_009100 [Trapa incisa]KAK4798825.1 hypothetical protein SAY86_031151 [Trapa natans]